MLKDRYPSRTLQTETLVPRTEPVVYSQWNEKSPISAEQQKHYAEKGYLVIEDFFSVTDLLEIKKVISQLRKDPDIISSDICITEKDDESIRSIFDLPSLSHELVGLAEDSRLSGIAAHILGDQVYVHQSRVNFKPAFHGEGFYWHSDFETWHVEDGMTSMRALSICLLLTDNFSYNGPLMVIPGSHQQFVACVGKTPVDHFKTSLKDQKYGVPSEKIVRTLAEKNGIVEVIARTGSIIIFDCNLLHASGSNMSPFPRENLFLVYNAVSNALGEPYGNQDPRPEYLARRTGLEDK